jgi:hypothetical protein
MIGSLEVERLSGVATAYDTDTDSDSYPVA